MEFAIVLICSLYYIVCFYIGHLTLIQAADWNPIETFIALSVIFVLCPIVSPVFIIVQGWISLHRDVANYKNTFK